MPHPHRQPPVPTAATTHAEIGERVARLIVIMAHQHKMNLPALASARRGHDTVLVEGEISDDFARMLRTHGHRIVPAEDDMLEKRIARAIRYFSKRRITITDPGDHALYRRVEAWAARFGVSVDIYFEALNETEQRTAA